MSYTIKPLADLTQLGSSAATIYTCPTNKVAGIAQAVLCNPTATARRVTVYLIPSGGSAGDSTTILKEFTIGPKSTELVAPLIGMALEAGDFIQGLADSASAVNIAVSGWERDQ